MSTPARVSALTWAGLAVVLTAAAVLSFAALRDLAIAVGISAYLAALLPVAVDAGAAVSCATWLSRRVPPDASRFAAKMTWTLLALTVVGNAGQLGMAAHAITPPWWVAVLVGAIPPGVVGGTVHVMVLLGRAEPAAPAIVADVVPAAAAPVPRSGREIPPSVPTGPHPVPAVPKRELSMSPAAIKQRKHRADKAAEKRAAEHKPRAVAA